MRKVTKVHYDPPVRTLNGWDMRIAGTETKIEHEDCDMANNNLMSREKQIEEIRKDIFAAFGGYAKWEEDWQSLAEAVCDAGYRKQEWISVKDRLPDDEDRFYLTCTDDGRLSFGIIITYPSGKYGFWTVGSRGNYGNKGSMTVAYWMPLPEVPKMKGGE